MAPRTLIAEPGPALRGWLAAGVGPRAGRVQEVACGSEVLWQLAEEPWDLVVLGPHLADLPPLALLAMARTAGVDTPFLLVLRFARRDLAGAARRMSPVELVDDWTDGHALRGASERLLRLQPEPRPRLPVTRGRLRRQALRRVGRELPG